MTKTSFEEFELLKDEFERSAYNLLYSYFDLESKMTGKPSRTVDSNWDFTGFEDYYLHDYRNCDDWERPEILEINKHKLQSRELKYLEQTDNPNYNCTIKLPLNWLFDDNWSLKAHERINLELRAGEANKDLQKSRDMAELERIKKLYDLQ